MVAAGCIVCTVSEGQVAFLTDQYTCCIGPTRRRCESQICLLLSGFYERTCSVCCWLQLLSLSAAHVLTQHALLLCRGDFGIDVGRNIIHGSDGVEVRQILHTKQACMLVIARTMTSQYCSYQCFPQASVSYACLVIHYAASI